MHFTQIIVYDTIDKELKNAIEDVIFNRNENATDVLVDLAEKHKGSKKEKKKDNAWRKFRNEPQENQFRRLLVFLLLFANLIAGVNEM